MNELVRPESLKHFREEIWGGREPRVFKGFADRAEWFRDLFGTERFDSILESFGEQRLRFGVDIMTARYRNGKRERPTATVCNSTSVWKLFHEGCTLQFLQPQRFIPQLREMCVSLESEIGCLVGCNAYLTPKHTQGLAPHHDDVELFICQTQGSKMWRLYRPLNGFTSPNGPSEDLRQDEIGEPIMDMTLHVGDVLYLPKGIIHQALAQEEDSVHLTISTYQRWTWGDLLSTVVQETLMATKEPVCLPESLREGLPLGFSTRVGRYTGDRLDSQTAAKQLAHRLRDLADAVEKRVEIVQTAADMMAYEFITSRMPPSDDSLPLQERYPTLDDTIKVTGQGFSHLLPVLSKTGNPDESSIQVLSCLSNDPQSHMMHYTESDDLAIDSDMAIETDATNIQITPVKENTSEAENEEDAASVVFRMDKREALMQIFNSSGEGVKVSDLRLPTNAERLELSGCLWEHGVVQIE